jgi:hypothetical protein
LNPRVGKTRADLHAEFVDDLAGRIAPRADAEEAALLDRNTPTVGRSGNSSERVVIGRGLAFAYRDAMESRARSLRITRF